MQRPVLWFLPCKTAGLPDVRTRLIAVIYVTHMDPKLGNEMGERFNRLCSKTNLLIVAFPCYRYFERKLGIVTEREIVEQPKLGSVISCVNCEQRKSKFVMWRQTRSN